MADQNEETSKTGESPESVSLADASAEKDTQGSDTDLEVEDPEKPFLVITGTELYLEACRLMELVPVSHFIQNLTKPYINLNHHGLGPKGVKAIAIALVSNTTVTHLELADNCILAEGAMCIVEMLRENSCLQKLNISNNHLDTAGAEAIASLLLNNTSYLYALQLSGNNFGEEAAPYFAEALMGNGALKILNLSWNGIGNEGALALGEALKVNNVLVHLDISNNRISNEGAKKLCRGLEVNGKLKILKNVLVNETFIKLLDLVCQTRPELHVTYGEIEGCITKIPKLHPNPMKVIQNYLKEHNLQLWDFFRNIDTDGNMKIPVAAFRRAMMQQSSIPLNRDQTEELLRKFDRNQTGVVDYSHLKEQKPAVKPVEEEIEEEKKEEP
ncbi:leucine-rich repeat-containing protein 74 [Limosa lapponica baueri]|uniref:Leucine-rich repeat-containing protein 74 n=1 Tax=Limosa lapponica baueri TaxID=1758121 RepID=A0A2I0U6P4_LIMLA|nr:leucine-rich repeat-containing protein 74 [Limosa lapponica baueri]